jgi:hypothetical protein
MEILSILSALMGVGTGVYQLLKGNEAADTEQPKYEIPKEYAQALGMAKQGAYSNMPGYQQAISNLQQSDASSFERAKDSASSGSDLLGFLANRGVTSNRGLNQLAAQNAAYKVGAEQRYMGALGQYGMLKDKQWNINELQPYQDAMRTSAVMTEGGIQNIFGGITGGIQNYAALKQSDAYSNYYNSLIDKDKVQPEVSIPPSNLGLNYNARFGGLNLNPNSNSGMGFGLQPGWGGYGQPSNSLNVVPVSNLGLSAQPQIMSGMPPEQQGSLLQNPYGLMDSYGMGNYYNWFNPG